MYLVCATDAQGPFICGYGRGLPAREQAASIGVVRSDSQGLGRRHGSGAADA